MNLEQITSLLNAFDRSSSTRLEYQCGEEHLVLEKAPAAPVTCAPAAAPAASSIAQDLAAAAPEQAACGQTIDAPLVGTFYVAGAPGEAPFVQPGDRVRKGQTIGLIEAMKMINEIPSPCDCVIHKVVAQDGALVGFGEALVEIQEL